MAVHHEDTCTLCDVPVGPRPVTQPTIDGAFCCHGCLTVTEALGDEAIEQTALSEADTDRTPPPAEAATCFLAVDGMHCTTCEAFLAARGEATDGIHDVTASYATDTVRVHFDDDMLDEAAVAAALSGYGYTLDQRRTGMDLERTADPMVSFLIGGGLFGMMVMLWYALFLYPTYFGFDPIVSIGGFESLYIYGNIWLFTSFVLFYTGKPILRGAYVSLRARAPNTDLLVGVAALSAYGYSTLAMGLGRTDLYFDVSVAIILVVTAGSYYETRMKRRALGDLAVTERAEDSTVQLPDGTVIDRSDLTVGDTVVIRPSERIPLDGTVVDGTAAVDTSLLTGEPRPREVGPGDTVPGGAIVTDQAIAIEVGDDSTRDRLLEALWSIQTSSPGMQRLVDRLATVFVPLVFTLAVIVGGGSYLLGVSGTGSLLLALTVMIVACPCALGLATPLAIAAGVRAGLRRGIVIARSSVFETASAIDIIVLDKTGTITEGEMQVRDVIGADPDTILERAAAVEHYSAHPIASAIVTEAKEALGWSPAQRPDGGHTISQQSAHARGVTATLDETDVVIGHSSLLRKHGYEIDASWQQHIAAIRSKGDRPVLVGWKGAIRGIIHIGDIERSQADRALHTLSETHELIVVTGDDGPNAEQYRSHPGISSVFAGVPPEGKAATIRRLRQRGRVAMVGDGSNDAPALATADLGIAVHNGTAMATDAADAIIDGDELDAVLDLFDIVTGTKRRMQQNLGWAFVYNGIAIPLAITGLLNPFLAAVAMATSSILVIANTGRPIVDA